MELFIIFEKYTKKNGIEIIQEELIKTIHYTGIYFIENDKLNNLEIINFIQFDAENFKEEYQENYRFACLISHINLDKIDKTFCKKFNINNYNYQNLFQKNYVLFIDSIIQCSKSFEHLNVLYDIFNIKSNSNNNKEIISQLIKAYKANNLKKNSLSIPELSKIIEVLFKLVSKNFNDNDNCIDDLIKGTEKNFSNKEMNEIFILILNSIPNQLNNRLIGIMINKISKSGDNLSNKDIIMILNYFTNTDIQIFFLGKLKTKVIKNDEFFQKELSNNLKLLLELINNGFFNEKFKNVDYVKSTKNIIDKELVKLTNFNFSMEQLKMMHKLNDENSLKSRLSILTLGDELILEELYSMIIPKINSCFENFEKIEEIINICSIYYPNENNSIINEYKRIREDILTKPINEFPNLNELNDFNILSEQCKKLSLFKKSKFFIEIYKKTKISDNNDDSKMVKKTKQNFFLLKKLFNENSENEVDKEFLEEILNKIKNDEIEEEIKILLNIFEINDNLNINICEKLKLLNNKKNTINKLHKIILLLKDFNLEEKNIQNSLETSIDNLKNYSSLNDLITINTNINNLNLKILDSNLNSKALTVIEKMYEKPELMDFLKNKDVNDIHQMGEFIDDSEDVYITIADINLLETCIKFIKELKKINYSDRQFLDNFIDIVNEENYKDIGIKFENSSGKYSDFHELYTNHLNPNDLNKQHIRKIHLSSNFTLNPSYPQYKCIVKYKINDKNIIKKFDEILDLRDIALLRKKDQKDEGYSIICDELAKNINQIQEILEILNIISSKGFYEEMIYEIEIKEGHALGYKVDQFNQSNINEKDLKYIISELNKIKENQDKEVKKIYLLNPITRMIYGKQFEFLYQIITQNFSSRDETFNILNNLLKYITNNNNKNQVGIIDNSNEENQLIQMYEAVNTYLNELLRLNFIDLENIYKKAFLLDKKKKGIYSHSCLLEDIEKNVTYCSLSLTGNFPIAQTVLYCNNSTSEEEIISFIYKSIKCDFNVLFILIKPENLSIDKKHLLIELLKDIYSENPNKMVSCLLFIYVRKNKTKEVITEIEKLPNHKYFDYEKNNDQIINQKFPNIKIYSSEFSGLGKSILIQNSFKNEDYNKEYKYIYFPLGGEINRNEIIERLLKLTNNKIALHLDLYDSNNIELLREFLFSFLILKYYSQNENIFYYGNEMKIKIEIPNSFLNYHKVFPILDFFENINIKQNNMPKLIVSDDLYSNIQIVCNYLKNINEINEKDIYFKGISDYESPNCIYAIQLSQEECSNLIFQNLNIEKPNFYQITSYINLIAEQLILFTNTIYLNVAQLKELKKLKKNTENIRYFFVHSLTLITKHFITSSYDNILKGQNVTYSQQKGKLDLEIANKEAIEILMKKESFSIKNIKPSMIFINEDNQSISEIVTCENDTDEYDLLKTLYNLDIHNKKKERNIVDYNDLNPEEFLIEVKKVLNLNNPINEKERKQNPIIIQGKELKTLESIVESYVFTSDNFIKLILISLRIKANIPIIMMGETGCGKTSLIRIIAELKDIIMYTLNIHAGIEDKDIIDFIKKNNLFEESQNRENKNIWVFLDEINTCNSLGLISEIMLKYSCKGKKIKNNVKFIAACNPYRLDTKEKEIIGLYDESKHLVRKLVYSVNPLPISLLNFVFDFGTPSKEDIKRYISNMVYQILKKIIPKNNNFVKIMNITQNSIFDAQDFIKNNFEISSVSLREVRRWGILFEWFLNFLKNPFFKQFHYSEENLYIYSLNLSIYLCYYIRIFNKLLKKQFCVLMKNSFGEDFNFESFPRKIQEILAEKVDLEKGIAKNRALLENLFSIFVCLNTKIPLFIIGKPGCSKSLSAQLIFKSMNGKDSFNEFFQYFPKVYTKSYQGSLTSNSKGILKIFEKARISLKDKKISNEIISSIYFDEMGLAEISKNNPLKVIHSQLEYDENKEKISFIGISNWPLDASKMNRGIHLSITEPDKEDLIDTALSIAESYEQRLIQDYKIYFEYLASTYFEYKEKLKNNFFDFEKNDNNKNISEFHGTRDFYHLIKTASKLFINNKFTKEIYDIENILNESIERNFGGLDNSIKIFKKLFKKYVPNINEINEYDVMNCIKNNIQDPTSRYLLIITKSSISHFLITLILDNLNKKHTFYYGSNFEEDNSLSYYSAKILNKIQVTMSSDNVMILKNLTSMYPSLYDLFNQNFRKVGDSNYARIALGDSNTQNYFVNDNFRCVILLDKNEIDEQDPPFINRFEKHIITFEYLLNKNQVKMSKQISKLLNCLIEKGEFKLTIDLKSQLLNCDLDEIQGIFYQLSEIFKKDKNIDLKNEDNNLFENNEFEIDTSILKNRNDELLNKMNNNLNIFIDKIYQKIIPTFSQDLILFAKNSNFAQKYNEEFKKILNIYLKEEYQHKNLKSYLERINSNKHIIYTFSNILDSVFGLNNEIKLIENNNYNSFKKEKTRNIFVEQYTSERAIDEKILDFYTNEKYNLCIFHFDIDDCIHLNHINYVIEGNENTLKDIIDIKSKVILFIIHLKRIIINNDEKKEKIHNEYLMSHLTEWKQFFIDNLNGNDISIKEIFDVSNLELFNNKNFIDLNEEFTKDLFHAFTLISYNIKINFSDIKNEEYIEKICTFINKNDKLKNTIQNIIINKIKKINTNLIIKIFTEYNFESNDVDLISVIIKFMKSIYNTELINTLIQLEKNNVLSTKLLNVAEMNNKYFDKIYDDYFNTFDFTSQNYNVFSQMVKINFILGISYPFIISVFNEINIYTNTLIERYLENEDKYRTEQFDNLEDYLKEKNTIENNLQKEFEKKYFMKILNDKENNLDKNKLQEILFNDYIIYFLSKSNKNFLNQNILNFFISLFGLFLSRDENNKKDEIQYSIENLSKFVLFIESYKDYIYPLCEFISSIDLYVKDFLNIFISKIYLKIFKINNRNIAYVNDIFFNLFESVIFCVLNIKEEFKDISDENFEKFLNEIKVFSNILMRTNIELRLTLKQILYLFDFIQVKEIFGKNGLPLKENLQIYFNLLKKENEQYLLSEYFNKNNKDENEENDIINEEFQFLKDKISHLKEYPNLVTKLLNNKIKISKKEKYRKKLLTILCSNNLFLIKSQIIFETILRKFQICPINKNKYDNNNKNIEDEEEEEENEYDEDGIGEIFLSQLKEEEDNLIIKFLNETNNICLDEILLSLFDIKFTNYFKLKNSKENKILNQSFDIFKKCVIFIENENCEILNNKLGILYCISYIKYYCYNFSKSIFDEEFEDLPKNELYVFLNGSNKFRKVIKIYILKILNLLILKNYQNFLDLIKEKKLFIDDFDFNEKVFCSLNYLFIQNDSFDYYKSLRKLYIYDKMEKFKSTKQIKEVLNENSIFHFYDLIINEEISNLITNFNEEFYSKLTHFILDILNKLNLQKLTKEILSIYFSLTSIENKILPLIKNFPISDYEILLYSHKLTFISSLSKQNTIYSKILSENILNNISNIYIPGIEPNDSLLIESGDQIKKYINNGGKEGIYMCSCYFWYTVGNCGRPVVTFPCKNCGQLLGGIDHKLIKRNGHIRIYRNENEFLNDGNSYKMFNQFMNEVENERNNHFKGFKKVKYEFFINKDKKVRNMSNVTYRVLSFIFYSCIYYCQILGYLNNNNINYFYFSDGNEQTNSIFFILKEIWKILIEELAKREVNNIQCFLNMIISELSKIISENNKNMNNPNERNEFENLCDRVIENAILNYNNYYTIYIKNNKEILEIEDETIKSILEETSDLNDLSKESYPLINYFYAANYPNYEKFLDQFNLIPNSNNQYPVITNYLNFTLKDEQIEFLENFELINPFVTYMIEKYSNKISREEAKKKLIKNEIENDENMKILFQNFKKGWEKIYKKLSNYDCHGQLPEKNISEEDCLAYCLNDNLEDNYGKYIATAYKDFITYQNNFLKSLIENNSNNEYLYTYSNQIKKEIIVQRANKKEIVSLNINNDIFKSFEDLIYTFSYRNCFKENGDINYLNYKENLFDFFSIEVELSKILLPEKRLFSNEQNQDFIIYAFEGFNQNECIILDFKEKIKEVKLLSNEEKANLTNIIERIDYKIILFNLQSLFLYFVNKRNINGEEILINEINQLPKKIIKLDDDFINIFKNSQFKIKLNQLIDCYEYVEFLNYDKILKNVSKKINVELDKKQIEELNKHFETKNKLLINKKELGDAVRKFISRFLIGDRFKNIDWNIFLLLKPKSELWNEKIISEEEQFNKEIDELDKINIKIKQSISFYEKLGGERIEINENKKNNKEKKNESKKKFKGKRSIDY